MGLILANLDCEVHWARQCTPGPHKDLPRPVRAAIARASRALSVFARPGDELWTLDDPAIDLKRYPDMLAWGQTDAATPAQTGEQGGKGFPSDQASWQDALWQLRAVPGAAARCNDRRFARALALDDEWSLPEIQALSSIEELESYLHSASLGPGDAWIAKAPFSASGRERVRRHGRRIEGEERVRTERLLARYGQLVVEPWMPRLADYGCAGVVYDQRSALRIFSPHELESDKTGVFRSVRIADRQVSASLGGRFSAALHDTAERAGQSLHAAGYRGPFGIDAFAYTDSKGRTRLQSLSEINARMSFGLVARALAEKAQQNDFVFRI